MKSGILFFLEIDLINIINDRKARTQKQTCSRLHKLRSRQWPIETEAGTNIAKKVMSL